MFWCWLQELVCSCADIVPASDDAKCEPDAQQSANDTMQHQHQILQHTNCDAASSSLSAPNPVAMYRTIAALLALVESSEDSSSGITKQTHATNTNTIGNQCEGSNSTDEVDHYNQYLKKIGIHFQKTAVQLLNQQHPPLSPPPPFDSCSADIVVAHDDIDSDHRNEYSFIDDDSFECRASNASANTTDVNDCDVANNYAMQSSLCNASSAGNTNQQQSNAHYDHEIGLANDCNSSSNSMINRIENSSASNNSNGNNDVDDDGGGGKSIESNSVKRPASVQIRRKTPNTLNLNLSNNVPSLGGRDIVSTKKRKISNLKRSYKQMNSAKLSERQALNEITEECEYDSDIGKFNCKPSADQQQQLMSDTSSGSYEFSEDSATIQTIGSPSSNDDEDDEGEALNLNDLNLTPKQRNLETDQSIELSFNINGSEKIVTKRIEFFENISGKSEEIEQELLEHKQDVGEVGVADAIEPKNYENDEKITSKPSTLNDIICFTSFVFAIVFMYFFPVLC